MKRIPIAVAKRLSQQLQIPEIVIVAVEDDGRQHVVTYGKTLRNCSRAAILGNNIKKAALGWPDQMCHVVPARIRDVLRRRNERSH